VDLLHPAVALLAKRATAEELEQARQIVANAIAEAGRLHEARYQRPARNSYRLKPGTVIGNGTTVLPIRRRSRSRRGADGAEAPPPLLEITEETLVPPPSWPRPTLWPQRALGASRMCQLAMSLAARHRQAPFGCKVWHARAVSHGAAIPFMPYFAMCATMAQLATASLRV